MFSCNLKLICLKLLNVEIKFNQTKQANSNKTNIISIDPDKNDEVSHVTCINKTKYNIVLRYCKISLVYLLKRFIHLRPTRIPTPTIKHSLIAPLLNRTTISS